MRTAGMEHSSSQGELQSDEIATMSKHQKDKIFVYLTDLLKPVLRVMSGHNKDARYYVPRTEINLHELGLSLDQATAMISPRIETWRDQQQSAEGDKSEAALNFLNVTLPFLAEVILQDSIYWTHDFPLHPISTLLIEKVHGAELQGVNYETWAIQKRAWCSEQERVIQDSGSSMATEMIHMRNEMEQMRKETKQQLDQVLEIVKQLHRLPTEHSATAQVPPAVQELNTPQLPASPPAIQAPVPQRRQLAVALRRTAAMPTIPVKLPLSMSTFMTQFHASKIIDWDLPSSTQSGWTHNLKN